MDQQAGRSLSNLPEGTVTFLFTDIEGSTELLKVLGDQYTRLLEGQRQIVRGCLEKWSGTEVDTQGDSFFISFPRATQAISAAVEIQKAIKEHEWPNGVEVHLRMGLHTGEPLTWAEGYVGIDVHRAARIAAVGHGGQVLLSETTTALIRGELPEGVSLQDLGTHVLKDISQPEQIHQLAIAGLATDFPPLASLESRPNNLPVQPTPFVGRMDELVAIDRLISEPDIRLISIVGAGGMGKTRLAIAAAEQQLNTLVSSNGVEEPRFPNGVFFVPLAPLETTEVMIPTIGQATGFQFYKDADLKQQILDYLRRKRMLLVMDNFEHLKNGASLLTEIVEAAPEVRILVTSREKLNLRGEVPYLLGGMRFPEGDLTTFAGQTYSAVELFLRSTRRICPDFSPTEEEMKSIGRISRLVEGMPLAVELAAAWMELLPPGEIASEIQRSLDLLEADKIDVPARHRSIRAVFDYTWDRLSEDEQDILKKISVFRGGFTTEAAREVAGGSNKQLLGLVNKSLLQRGSTDRLAIHELLRQYAAEKLEQNQALKDEVRDLHCAYYADFLQEREGAIDGGDTSQAFDEIDNIRLAWGWAVRREKIPEIRKQIHSYSWLLTFQGWRKEGEDLFRWAVYVFGADESEGDKGIVYGQLLESLGSFCCMLGIQNEGIAFIRESRAILRRLKAKPELAITNMSFAFHDVISGAKYVKESEEHMLESLEYYKDKPTSWKKANIFNSMGIITLNQYRYEEADNYFRKGLQLGEALNHRRIIGWSNSGLGYIALHRGEIRQAREHWEQARSNYQVIGFKEMVAYHLNDLGHVLKLMGEVEEAKEHYLKALSIDEDIGNQDGIAFDIYGLGDVAFDMGDYSEAKERYNEALALFRNEEDQRRPAIGNLLCDLGMVAVAMGDEREAHKKLVDALETGIQHQFDHSCLKIFVGISTLLAMKGEMSRAVELASLAVKHPSVFTSGPARKQLAQLEGLLPPEEFSAAQERGKELDLWITAEQLLTELKG